MAEPKSNVIEYSFQGDTLGLQEAVKKVRAILTSTVAELKKLQGGKLTAEQEKQVKYLRKLASQMAANAKKEDSLTEEQKKKTLVAGRYALAKSQEFAKKAQRAKEDAAKKAEQETQKQEADTAKKRKKLEELVSVAGQESAKQRATYLEEYADKFKQVLSEEAYDEIKQAVADYRAAIADTSTSEEDLAEVTERLQKTYRNYSQTLQAVNRSQQQASKGILSISDFFKEGARQAKVAVKSFSFWLKMIRKVVQIATEYTKLLEQLRRSGQLNNPNLKGIKQTADVWRSLSRQLSLFVTNIGHLVTTVLAPVIKLLSGVLMVINALMAGLTGMDALAENAREGAGLTGLDEINSQSTQEEDKLKKMRRGWQDIKAAMQPVVDLAKTLGTVIYALLTPVRLVWGLLGALWNLLKPIFDGIVTGLNLIVSGIMWVVNWVVKAIDWFVNLLGVTGEWTKEGAGLYNALKWIGIFLSGFVAIALSKWVLAAAKAFGTLAVNIAKAAAKLVVYIAKQTVAIAKTIASTIANWWENASLAAKIGLVTLGAGLVVVPIALAAAGVFKNEASSVPAMARGGVVTQPTMALIGEGQYNEAVVPLGNSPQFASMKEGIAQEVITTMIQGGITGSTRSSRPTEVVLNVNGRELARAIVPDIGNVKPQTGVKFR